MCQNDINMDLQHLGLAEDYVYMLDGRVLCIFNVCILWNIQSAHKSSGGIWMVIRQRDILLKRRI